MPDAQATQTPQRATRRGATDAVTVACSLPNGMLLQVYDVEEVQTSLPNGSVIRENVSTLSADAGQFMLNGSSLDRSALAEGRVPDYRVIAGSAPGTGYGLTTGVPRALWERWLTQNERGPLVRNRVVFAAESEPRAADEAREYRDLKSGLQGLNPAGDYRVPSGRGIRKYNPNDNRVTPEQPELPPE